MSWLFQQTGHLFTPEGKPAAHQWYSGHGEHANVPGDEGLRGLGPLPRGVYALGALIAHPTSLGPVAIHLIPFQETSARIVLLGRDPMSFYIHDGDRAHDLLASEGCLVSMDGSGPVLNMWNNSDHVLMVVPGNA